MAGRKSNAQKEAEQSQDQYYPYVIGMVIVICVLAFVSSYPVLQDVVSDSRFKMPTFATYVLPALIDIVIVMALTGRLYGETVKHYDIVKLTHRISLSFTGLSLFIANFYSVEKLFTGTDIDWVSVVTSIVIHSAPLVALECCLSVASMLTQPPTGVAPEHVSVWVRLAETYKSVSAILTPATEVTVAPAKSVDKPVDRRLSSPDGCDNPADIARAKAGAKPRAKSPAKKKGKRVTVTFEQWWKAYQSGTAHDDIADNVGVSVRTLYRRIEAWEKAGTIKRDSKESPWTVA